MISELRKLAAFTVTVSDGLSLKIAPPDKAERLAAVDLGNRIRDAVKENPEAYSSADFTWAEMERQLLPLVIGVTLPSGEVPPADWQQQLAESGLLFGRKGEQVWQETFFRAE